MRRQEEKKKKKHRWLAAIDASQYAAVDTMAMPPSLRDIEFALL